MLKLLVRIRSGFSFFEANFFISICSIFFFSSTFNNQLNSHSQSASFNEKQSFIYHKLYSWQRLQRNVDFVRDQQNMTSVASLWPSIRTSEKFRSQYVGNWQGWCIECILAIPPFMFKLSEGTWRGGERFASPIRSEANSVNLQARTVVRSDRTYFTLSSSGSRIEAEKQNLEFR